MPSTFTCPLIVVIPGQVISASLWNSEFENISDNFIPAGMDDYSATDGNMQQATDPYPAGITSRPTSLAGEIERLRYAFSRLQGTTYWYQSPDVDINTFKTRFDAHTHSGAANQGPQILTAGLADNSVTLDKMTDSSVGTSELVDLGVTTGKINDLAVTTDKINDLGVTTGKIAAAAVDENKLATSVAGNGLAGGAGTALSVNVDGTGIEINSDTLRLKDLGVVTAKINDLAVTTGKINDLAVTTGKINDLSVTTGKINTLAVTDAKVNDVAATKITGTLPIANGGTALTTYLVKLVNYTGNGAGGAGQAITHGMGATPDMILIIGSGISPILYINGVSGSTNLSSAGGVSSVGATTFNAVGNADGANVGGTAYKAICFKAQA